VFLLLARGIRKSDARGHEGSRSGMIRRDSSKPPIALEVALGA
jgi:hypothetical protein